ncbi:kielin/chordin-like protein [Glandiceps talaboti]
MLYVGCPIVDSVKLNECIDDDDGSRHLVGTRWQKNKCTMCTCEVGGELSCNPVPCFDPVCSHPFTPPGECCPQCDDCMYLGKEVKNGEEFKPSDDACSTCRCVHGNIACDTVDCPPTDCDNPKVPKGSCCPECGGCEYEGTTFANGDFFTPMSNPCLRCSCAMSIVRCNPIFCPDVPCSNPVQPLGACCEMCPDTCLYEGEEYKTGDSWTTIDGCKQCNCQQGDITCLNIQPCPIDCEHGVIPSGQCCSACTDCVYEGQFIRNGLSFVANGDLCNQCTCRDGSVQCQIEECPVMNCQQTEVLQGSCCPVCRGCIDRFGTRHDHNDEWRLQDDDCNVCRCYEGDMTCSVEQCNPVCRHPVNKPGMCCPVCHGCFYQGDEYANGATVDDNDKCTDCVCQEGTVTCLNKPCLPTLCPDPVIPMDKCCPVCEVCTYNGQPYQNGQTFIAPRNPCLECTCQDGRVDCQRLDLDCQPQCTHPGRTIEQCCPVCDICEYERRNYRNGGRFRPETGDKCDTCTCTDGTVTCQTQVCPPSPCSNPVQKDEECCPVCQVCVADGVEHQEGETWDSLADPCAVCTCEVRIGLLESTSRLQEKWNRLSHSPQNFA